MRVQYMPLATITNGVISARLTGSPSGGTITLTTTSAAAAATRHVVTSADATSRATKPVIVTRRSPPTNGPTAAVVTNGRFAAAAAGSGRRFAVTQTSTAPTAARRSAPSRGWSGSNGPLPPPDRNRTGLTTATQPAISQSSTRINA